MRDCVADSSGMVALCNIKRLQTEMTMKMKMEKTGAKCLRWSVQSWEGSLAKVSTALLMG